MKIELRDLSYLPEFLLSFAVVVNHALSELFDRIAGTSFLSHSAKRHLDSATSTADPLAASLRKSLSAGIGFPTDGMSDLFGLMPGCVRCQGCRAAVTSVAFAALMNRRARPDPNTPCQQGQNSDG